MDSPTDLEERLVEIRRQVQEAAVERARAEERAETLKAALQEIREALAAMGVDSLAAAREEIDRLRAKAAEALARAERAVEDLDE